MARFPGVNEIRVSERGETTVHFELVYNDATGTYTIPVKSGTFVKELGVCVLTAFDATSPTLTAGDGDDASGYIANANITWTPAPAAGAAQIVSSIRNSNDYQYGKYYRADDTIDFAWNLGTSGTTGVLKGYVVMSNVRNDSIDGGAAATA